MFDGKNPFFKKCSDRAFAVKDWGNISSLVELYELKPYECVMNYPSLVELS